MRKITFKKIKSKVSSLVNISLYKTKLTWYNLLNRIGTFDRNNKIIDLKFNDEWEYRITTVLKSEYNQFIPRVKNSGEIQDGYQVMHNGLKIVTGGYYGLAITKMLFLNRGVHEPEEEKIFMDILKKIPTNAVMLEMGAYWSFYSMWFLKEVSNGSAYMIEPEKENIEIGKLNFIKNNLAGNFDQYYLGASSTKNEPIDVITLDDFIEKKNIKHLHIAHADIQGHEMSMLRGAVSSLDKQIIDYFFISTHTNKLHYECLEYLESMKYVILYSFDMDVVSSADGLLVAHSPQVIRNHSLK